jgi:hypothetical protein
LTVETRIKEAVTYIRDYAEVLSENNKDAEDEQWLR